MTAIATPGVRGRARTAAIALVSVVALPAIALVVVLPHWGQFVRTHMTADKSSHSFTQVGLMKNDGLFAEDVVGISVEKRADVKLTSLNFTPRQSIPRGGVLTMTLHLQVLDCQKVLSGPLAVDVHLTRLGLPHTLSWQAHSFDPPGDGVAACGLKSS